MEQYSTLRPLFDVMNIFKDNYQIENDFAKDLVAKLVNTKQGFCKHSTNSQKVLVKNPEGGKIKLILTPVHARLQTVTAYQYFHNIRDAADLISAYRAAKQSMTFEDVLDNLHVHNYAENYLSHLIEQADKNLSPCDAKRIGDWVKNFDIYVAVKCIESLVSSKADLIILKLAKALDWSIHFDHLAIRCGSAKYRHAEAVVELLKKQHGYIAPQIKEEQFYQFTDGWNAYLLYKVLNNGQILRLFIDQSNANVPEQIIQHWNYVYGFTAHHLAVRATKIVNKNRVEVPLVEIISELKSREIEVMTPTGLYTLGLLQQVFACPEVNHGVPTKLTQLLSNYENNLEVTIKNAKLLELVSRSEMDEDFAKRFFKLYGLEYNAYDPLHSTPIYNYFLPTQAEHVIKTSLNIFQ